MCVCVQIFAVEGREDQRESELEEGGSKAERWVKKESSLELAANGVGAEAAVQKHKVCMLVVVFMFTKGWCGSGGSS